MRRSSILFLLFLQVLILLTAKISLAALKMTRNLQNVTRRCYRRLKTASGETTKESVCLSSWMMLSTRLTEAQLMMLCSDSVLTADISAVRTRTPPAEVSAQSSAPPKCLIDSRSSSEKWLPVYGSTLQTALRSEPVFQKSCAHVVSKHLNEIYEKRGSTDTRPSSATSTTGPTGKSDRPDSSES